MGPAPPLDVAAVVTFGATPENRLGRFRKKKKGQGSAALVEKGKKRWEAFEGGCSLATRT